MILRILVSAVLAYLIVKGTVPYFRRLALNLDWLDTANSERKTHTDSVPVVGGLVMALSIFLTILLNSSNVVVVSNLTQTLLIGGGILLTTGTADDKLDLPPLVKLCVQACCAYFLCAQGLYLDRVFEVFALGSIPMYLKQCFTILFVIGTVNAYNLIDGIDGLAGSLFAAGFAWTGATALYFGHVDIALLSGTAVAAATGFLEFNNSKDQKIFMGDGGSLFLGFLLAGLSIATMERGALGDFSQALVVGSGAVLALPVLDELRVFAERMAAGRSPMYADRSHIHHILLQIDSTHVVVRNWILRGVVGMFVASVATALLVGFWSAIFLILLCMAGLFTLLNLQQSMHYQRQQLRKIENRRPAPPRGRRKTKLR